MFDIGKYKKYLKHAKLGVAILLVILGLNVLGVILSHWQTIVIIVVAVFVIGFLLKFLKIVK